MVRRRSPADAHQQLRRVDDSFDNFMAREEAGEYNNDETTLPRSHTVQLVL